MKYIVAQVALKGHVLEVPILFPESLVHSMVYAVIKVLLEDQYKTEDVKCVSAGFVHGPDTDCYGKSDSLKIESRGKIDDILFLTSDYGGGIK